MLNKLCSLDTDNIIEAHVFMHFVCCETVGDELTGPSMTAFAAPNH